MPALIDFPFSVLVLLLGSANVIACWGLARARVWPVFLYWFGWTAGTYAAESLSGDGVMPVFTATTRELLLRLHIAAAIGFTLACAMFHLARGATRSAVTARPDKAPPWRMVIHPRFLAAAFVIQLSLGILLLVFRLRSLGSVSYGALLSDIRDSYIQTAGLGVRMPPIVRLGSHAANFLILFPFFFGTQDGLEDRTRFRRVLLWWVCSIPGGLSTGGRGWIVTAPMVYFISFLVASGDRFNFRFVRRWTLRIIPVILILAALFSAIEKGRHTNQVLENLTTSRWYDKAPFGKAVVYYLGLPILGVDAYTQYAREGRPYNGTLTFEFFAAQWQRVSGAHNRTADEFNVASRSAMFFSAYPILFATHVPIIPNLVADFGPGAFPYIVAILCFTTALAYLILWQRGLIGRFVAVTIGLAWFWSFQSLMLGDAGMVLPVVWLALILWLDALLRGARVYSRPWVALRPVSRRTQN